MAPRTRNAGSQGSSNELPRSLAFGKPRGNPGRGEVNPRKSPLKPQGRKRGPKPKGQRRLPALPFVQRNVLSRAPSKIEHDASNFTRMGPKALYGQAMPLDDGGIQGTPQMDKVVKGSMAWPNGLPLFLKGLTALSYVAERVLPPALKVVPAWQKEAWDAGVSSMFTDAVAAHLTKAQVEAACLLLYPLHHRDFTVPVDDGAPLRQDHFAPMCTDDLDLRAVRGGPNAPPSTSNGAGPSTSTSMPLDPLLKLEVRRRQKYLMVCLGRNHNKSRVWEYAHRLVSWMVQGPSHPDQVCMHLCDNGLCLAGRHLVWGSKVANRLGPGPNAENYKALWAQMQNERPDENSLPGQVDWQPPS